MTDPNYIGAVATIQWTDTDKQISGMYFSFEEFPEGADSDYVLPLAKLADWQVFLYCDSVEEFLAMTEERDVNNEFTILDYDLITPVCGQE